MLAFYKTFDEIRNERYDGLIMSRGTCGDDGFWGSEYWDELCEIYGVVKTHIHSTFHICWGAQAGLYYHYGIQNIFWTIRFPVFFPQTFKSKNRLFRGLDTIFYVPHSRHTTVYAQDIEKVPELKNYGGFSGGRRVYGGQ